VGVITDELNQLNDDDGEQRHQSAGSEWRLTHILTPIKILGCEYFSPQNDVKKQQIYRFACKIWKIFWGIVPDPTL